MSEWWTYGLQDFLMFAPATYQRLFALYNAALWPAQVVALPLGLLSLWLLAQAPARWRIACAITAAGWACTAIAFHWQRYADIHTAARWFALAFVLQALMLAGIAWPGSRWQMHAPSAWPQRVGLLLFVLSALVLPWFGVLLGRPWQQAALFGLTPDATALGTLGLLLCLRRTPSADARWRYHLWAALPWALPLAWCLVSAATLWTLQMPEAGSVAGMAAIALVCAVAVRVRPHR